MSAYSTNRREPSEALDVISRALDSKLRALLGPPKFFSDDTQNSIDEVLNAPIALISVDHENSSADAIDELLAKGDKSLLSAYEMVDTQLKTLQTRDLQQAVRTLEHSQMLSESKLLKIIDFCEIDTSRRSSNFAYKGYSFFIYFRLFINPLLVTQIYCISSSQETRGVLQ